MFETGIVLFLVIRIHREGSGRKQRRGLQLSMDFFFKVVFGLRTAIVVSSTDFCCPKISFFMSSFIFG